VSVAQHIICHVCREVVHVDDTIMILAHPIYDDGIDYDAEPITTYACKDAGKCMERFVMGNVAGHEVRV
jgi:hypothetical protein